MISYIRIALLLSGAGVLFSTGGVAGAWDIETVDQTGAGIFSSLAFDRLGNAHLAYVIDDGSQYPLKYAFWDHALKRWFPTNVATHAGFCSLVVDSKGSPHIAFVDSGPATATKLRYARWNGTGWTVEAIPVNSQSITSYTSIALDRDDRPVISFYESRGARNTNFANRLRVVMWSGTYWKVQTVDADEGSGRFNAIAIDRQGAISVAYATLGSGSMRYALWDNKWQMEYIEPVPRGSARALGYSAAMALDKAGTPHVTYVDSSTAVVQYAVRRDGTWKVEPVDQLGKMASQDRNSIAVSDNGRPYVGYYDAAEGKLKLARRTEAGWVREVIDTGFAGYTSSLQIRGGAIWISYADQSHYAIKVARRELVAEEARPVAAASATTTRIGKNQ